MDELQRMFLTTEALDTYAKMVAQVPEKLTGDKRTNAIATRAARARHFDEISDGLKQGTLKIIEV